MAFPKIKSVLQLYEILPENERILVDILRQIVKENLPDVCKENISFNVLYFHREKGISISWPSAVPRGGLKSGVLLGFWCGSGLKDANRYLTHGTNKQILTKSIMQLRN